MKFYQTDLRKETLWRAIILFGRNVASYKFALGASLLSLARDGQTFISLEELAPLFSAELCRHIKETPRQGTFCSSQFLNACMAFNAGEITQETLVQKTVKNGFNNVIDAFHVVNMAEVPIRFFRDERRKGQRIVLTDDLLSLVDAPHFNSLPHELEARWRLVETAWSLDLAPSLLQVSYAEDKGLIIFKDHLRRVDIASCRDALNGYQKGSCFYSNDTISLEINSPAFCDIDHFFPHTLKQFPEYAPVNLDGVWNLVLSCQRCNRGEAGKFSRVPSSRLLERLHCRNEYYISSHHPLRETIMNQTGDDEKQRRSFLQRLFDQSRQRLIHTWESEEGMAYETI